MTQRKEEEALSSDEPYELKEKINDVVSMPSEGPQEGPTTTATQDGMPLGTTANDVPMEQGCVRATSRSSTMLRFLQGGSKVY